MANSVVVRIEAIAAGGAGVGRLDGKVVFVPRTAPGDEVAVSLRQHKRHAEGRVQRLITAGPARVVAPCAHYTNDRCGGCQLQHLSYDAQLDAKRDMVIQAFRRIGRREVTIDGCFPSPSPWRYRNKLTLGLRQTAGVWRAGLRPYDAPDELFRLDDCLITGENVMHSWREILGAARYLPTTPRLRGAVREVRDGCTFVLSGGDRWDTAADLGAACPSLAAVKWEPEGAPARVVWTRDGAQAVGAFAQINAAVADALHGHVAERVGRQVPRKVIDAYGGDGSSARRLVTPEREVVVIERDAVASGLAVTTLGSGARVVTAPVEDVLARELPADVVILNPPRSGVDASVCSALERGVKPRTLIYVGCDPATLARDVARLPSYAVRAVTLFDMFPQTAHVETVCELAPEVT